MDSGAVETCDYCKTQAVLIMAATIDYVKMASDVATIISNNGRNVTIIKKVKGTPADVAKPWRADTGSTTEETVKAVIGNFKSEEIDGRIIKKGDKKFLIAANAVSAAERPKIRDFDLVTDSSETWRIMGVDVVEPGSLPILFIMHVSKKGT